MQIRLYPLTLAQMEARLAGAPAIDDLQLSEEIIPEIVLSLASEALKRGESPQWRAPCLFLLGDSPVAIGSAAFMSEPVSRRVEIGYGVASAYAGRGFATAGVRLMVEAALAQPDIDQVYAETAVGNVASRRVVEKVGFTHIGQRESEHDGRVDQWLLSRPSATR